VRLSQRQHLLNQSVTKEKECTDFGSFIAGKRAMPLIQCTVLKFMVARGK
jgi:hypothetical protein